ncbi:hypothetical protein DL96DRAFT_1605656 [Flagelloscypha sp. PMI_526]|nr:hypothetical protein DL96DRAFT_1605656 [Flagelloscypha sp. PMI_526]
MRFTWTKHPVHFSLTTRMFFRHSRRLTRYSCPTLIHPSTQQRLHRSSDIPLTIAPSPGGITDIQWNDGHSFNSDPTPKSWTTTSKLFIDSPTAIDQLLIYGLLFVTGVPNQNTSDSNCELRKLSSNFGELKHTFYGQVWDVQNIADAKNIAYTNHPPKYQILHCLRNRVKGGGSLFFAVPFHYLNDSHHLHYRHPTIELSHDEDVNGDKKIGHLNYSPPFQAPLPVDTPPEFYQALAKFTAYLDDPANVYRYLLKEGDAVIFDNRRVLHARDAFENLEGSSDTGEPNRWLKGCYFEPDAMMDKGRVLRKAL